MSFQGSQIMGFVWFTDRKGTIGIVLCQSDITKRYSYKAYIAIVSGGSKGIDALYVANCGAKFPATEAISLIQKSGEINYKYFPDTELLKETFINETESKH